MKNESSIVFVSSTVYVVVALAVLNVLYNIVPPFLLHNVIHLCLPLLVFKALFISFIYVL